MAGKHSQVGSNRVIRMSKEVSKMVKIIIVFVIAIVFLAIAFRIKTAHKNESIQMGNYNQTYAAIERVIFSDTGEVKYYVSFLDEENKIIAQTHYYSSKTKSLNPGDEVKIGYFFNKRGTPRAVIFDERVIPVSNSVPGFYKFMTIVGILLLLIAVVMFARLMLF